MSIRAEKEREPGAAGEAGAALAGDGNKTERAGVQSYIGRRHGKYRWNYLKTRITIFWAKSGRLLFASLVLTAAGFISIAAKGGLKYGIDFKQGVMMTVKFAYTPPLDKIRSAMSASPKIKGEVSVQN